MKNKVYINVLVAIIYGLQHLENRNIFNTNNA